MLIEDSANYVEDLDVGVALYATDRLDEHVPARLREKRGNFLVFRTKAPLKKGRRLITEDADRRTEVEVNYCRECTDGSYEMGCDVVSVKDGIVRREWRLSADIPAQITVVGEAGKHKARVVNISPSGLGLHIPIAVQPGAELVVQMKDGSGYGDVRHCRKVGKNRYYAGLFIQEFLDREPESARGITGSLQGLIRSLKRLANPAYSRGR